MQCSFKATFTVYQKQICDFGYVYMTLSEKMFSKRFHGCTCLKCFMSLEVPLPPQYYQGIFGRFLIIVRNCTIPHSYRICVGFQRYSGTTGKPEISRVMFRR